MTQSTLSPMISRSLLFVFIVVSLSSLICQAASDCNQRFFLEEDKAIIITNNLQFTNTSLPNDIESCSYVVVNNSPLDSIKIEFIEFNFQEAECVNEQNQQSCCDYMQIGSGSVVGEHSMSERLCGDGAHGRLEPIIVSEETAWINYKTDSTVPSKGFMLRITSYKLFYEASAEKIGFLLSPSTGNSSTSIMSYVNNLDLVYTIFTSPDSLIWLKFNLFDLEQYENLCYDYLQLIDDNRQPEIGTEQTAVSPLLYSENRLMCGSERPNDMVFAKSNVHLRFVTDSSESQTGFKITYGAIKYIFEDDTDGIIETPVLHSNITYVLRAPQNQRIELVVEKFDFQNCIISEAMSTKFQFNPISTYTCSESNDYMKFTNDFSASMSEFNTELDKTVNENNEWIFCACNKPVRTYLSLSNHLNITYFSSNKRFSNFYRLKFRFVQAEYNLENKLSIVQDETKSFIGGYLLNLNVPAGHHVRLQGNMNLTECVFQRNILLGRNLIEQNKIVNERVDRLDWDFGEQCSFLTDIGEPSALVAPNSVRVDGAWQARWFIKFPKPTDNHGFILSWTFFKNRFVNEPQTTRLILPIQNGYFLNEELSFSFESQRNGKNYTLFISSSALNEKSDEKNYLKVTSLDNIVPLLPLTQEPLRVEMQSVQLKVMRGRNWMLNIDYAIDEISGECDFDVSTCNYTLTPDERQMTSDQTTRLEHLAKHVHIDLNNHGIRERAQDFYMSISKQAAEEAEQEAIVYSPTVKVQTELTSSGNLMYNRRVLSISFDYMTKLYADGNLDQLEMFIVPNRSDLNVESNINLNAIQTFFTSPSTIELNKPFSLVPESCEAKSFRKSFVMANSMPQSETITSDQLAAGFYWRRAERVLVYSCFDFQLGFAGLFKEKQTPSNNQNHHNSTKRVGIDNIQLNFEESEVEECVSEFSMGADTCNARGKCVRFNNKEMCCCDPGFDGPNCENKVSACDFVKNTRMAIDSSEPICYNGGECIDDSKAFAYSCQCPVGYAGEHCETEINECDSQPCQNNAKCVDLIGSYKCVCNEGDKGENCELKSDSCFDRCNPKNTLECLVTSDDEIICNCKPGYDGSECSEDINECSDNPCFEGSTCVDGENKFSCECPPHMTGRFCELKVDFCDRHGHLCKSGSKCIEANEDASVLKCSCPGNFTGQSCEIPVDVCKPNPCLHNATCERLGDGYNYKCNCPLGTYGHHCETNEIDSCDQNECKNNAKCLPGANGDYACQCVGHYTGDLCEIELCDTEKHFSQQCNQTGTLAAVDTNGNCECLCKTGYKGDFCDRFVGMCELNNVECQNGGTCIEMPQVGAGNLGLNSISDLVKCQCTNDYEGERCEIKKDWCLDVKCSHGSCKFIDDSYKCECLPGWTGESCSILEKTCTKEIDCVPENTISVHRKLETEECFCKCKKGFEGAQCEKNIDDCAVNKCANNGTCIDLVSTFQCKCLPGYTGSFCERKLSGCQLKPCHFGTCVEEPGKELECKCNYGYEGKYCEKLIDKCESKPCQNGGKCHNLITDYYCECPYQYGPTKNCSVRIRDPCLNNPCENGGTCAARGRLLSDMSIVETDKHNGLDYYDYSCSCTPNFGGKHCDKPKYESPCESSPCLHGACSEYILKNSNTVNFKCKCFPSYRGDLCDEFFDECIQHKCGEHGKCYVTGNGPTCECDKGYVGERCEKKIQPCDFFVCENGGKCVLTLDQVPYCQCETNRFTGTRCQIDLMHENSTSLLLNGVKNSPIKSFDCHPFGSDVSGFDTVIVILIIFGIVVCIITFVYLWVNYSTKKAKRKHNSLISEHQMLNDMNEMSEKYV